MSDLTFFRPNIAIGGWHGARDCHGLFTDIVNVAIDAPQYGNCHYFPIVDGPGNTVELMTGAIDKTVELIKSGRTFLIHCIAGRSRSLTVLAAAMHIAANEKSYQQYIDELRIVRGPCNENQPHPDLVAMAAIIIGNR